MAELARGRTGSGDQTGPECIAKPGRAGWKPRSRGSRAGALLTAGSITVSGATAIVTPPSVGPDVAVVSIQKVGGSTMLDVNLNGLDNYFAMGKVGFVYYEGAGASGPQTFVNNTSLHTVAWGGSGANLFESNGGAQDEFFGGSGSNTFDAGTGFDIFIGGTGSNTYNENATGSGEIFEAGSQNIINVPPGATGHYYVT